MVLDDPSVEAAVLETARGGIVRRGLGYDQADVAVVTNITADHLGCDGVDDLDELIHVKALVAEEIRDGGCVVLNADDPASAGMADRRAVRLRSPVVRYFSLQPGNPVLRRHKLAGGLCYEVIDGQLTETDGGQVRPLISVADVPGAFGGRAPHVVANALAALAACRALGVNAKDCRRGLTDFSPAEHNPGRGDVYLAGSSPIILDYGHNAAAIAATGRFVADVWGIGRDVAAGEADIRVVGEAAAMAAGAVAAVTLPGDRRDDLLVQSAQAVAASFGTVVLYEDRDRRGRQPGEMTSLITAALRSARPGIVCEEADGPVAALRAALELASGGPVLFVYEKLAMAREALASIGAQPWSAT
jgi:cyanophycin synthetase